ncbi:tetratricopeptide repeat protein [Flavobacterium tegetincola]|uniref:tetratricopeptide repeat protein n=1 Tax=Flavobacterium tegetincola TaxID=150172 RepID=UPI00040E7C77|nr:tetratricopeptide repeat protein [Flavobacterium tegetincola]
MKTQFIYFIALFFTISLSAQQTGYWDKTRVTSKEITLGAGNRISVKSEDFPKGTTEIIYRITLLDDNQQLATSLVSLLKSVPDPSGISQGSAGAVFLMSKISGDDKCTYALFSSEEKATNYKESGQSDVACFVQNTPLSKEAKLFSLENSKCLKANSQNIWFAFESQNWIMKQKIVLEIVPWVDTKLSRGWSQDNKKSIIDLCKTSDLAELMGNSNDFCVCILEQFMQKYTFPEYQKLLAAEKSKAYKDFGAKCLTNKPENQAILNTVRISSFQYFNSKKYDRAIRLLKVGLIDNGNGKVMDYNALGTYYLYSKQYEKATQALQEAEKMDESELLIQLNLAHVYLLNDQYNDAKTVHKKYKNQNVSATESWINRTKADFEEMKKAGIQSDNFERILKLIQE